MLSPQSSCLSPDSAEVHHLSWLRQSHHSNNSAAAILQASIRRLGMPVEEFRVSFGIEPQRSGRVQLADRSPVQLGLSTKAPQQFDQPPLPFEAPVYARTRPQVMSMRHHSCSSDGDQYFDPPMRELIMPADPHLSGATEASEPRSPPLSAVAPRVGTSDPSGWTLPQLGHSSAANVVLGAKWRAAGAGTTAKRRLAGPFDETSREAKLRRQVALRQALARWIRNVNQRDFGADAGCPDVALSLSIAEWHIHSLDEITSRSNHSLAWLPDVLAGGPSHSLPRSFTLPRRFREWRVWAKKTRCLKAQLGYRRALQRWSAGVRDADALHRRDISGSRQRATLTLRHRWKRWARLARIRRRAFGSLPLLRGAILRWRSRSRVAFRADNLRSERLALATNGWRLRQTKISFRRLEAAVAELRLDRQRHHRAIARASAGSIRSAWRALRNSSTIGKAAGALCSSAVVVQARRGQRRAWGRLQARMGAERWVQAVALFVGIFQVRRALQVWRSSATDVAGELAYNVQCRQANSAIRRWVLLLQATRAFGVRRSQHGANIVAFRLSRGFQRLHRRARAEQVLAQGLSHFTGIRVRRRVAAGWRRWIVCRTRARIQRSLLEKAASFFIDASTRETWRRVVQRARAFRRLGVSSRSIEGWRIRRAWLRWPLGTESEILQTARRITFSAFWAGSSAARAMARWQQHQAESLSVLQLRGLRTVLPRPAGIVTDHKTLLERERVRRRVFRHLACGLPLLSTHTAVRIAKLRFRHVHSAPPSLVCNATWHGPNAARPERWPLISQRACTEEQPLIARPPLLFWRFVHGLVLHAARRNAATTLGHWRSYNQDEQRWAASSKEAMVRMMRGLMRAWRSGCVGVRAANIFDRQCKRDAAYGLHRMRTCAAGRSLAGRAFGRVAHRTACSRLVRGFFSGFVASSHESRAKLKVARALGQHEPWRERRNKRRALVLWVESAVASTDAAQRSRLHRVLACRFHGAAYFATWAAVAREQAAATVMAARMVDRGRTACLRVWQAGAIRRKASAALAMGCIAYRHRNSLVRCLFQWRIHVHELQWCMLALSVAQGGHCDWDSHRSLTLQDTWGTSP